MTTLKFVHLRYDEGAIQVDPGAAGGGQGEGQQPVAVVEGAPEDQGAGVPHRHTLHGHTLPQGDGSVTGLHEELWWGCTYTEKSLVNNSTDIATMVSVHTEKYFSKSYEIKLNSDCIYHFPIDLEPIGHLFGT